MSEKTNVRDIEKKRFLAELRIKLEEAADDIKNNRVYDNESCNYFLVFDSGHTAIILSLRTMTNSYLVNF